MATKYTRKSYRENAMGSEGYRDMMLAPTGIKLRRPWRLIVMGLVAISGLLVCVQYGLPQLQFGGMPVKTVNGVVFSRTSHEGRDGVIRRRIGVAVRDADGETRAGYLTPDDPQWTSLNEGDIVSVAFQAGRWGHLIQIHSVVEVAPAKTNP